MLCSRPLSSEPGFSSSGRVLRMELPRNSAFDHDDNVVVHTYASKRLDESIKLVQYLLFSSSPSLSFQFHVGRPPVVLLDSVSCLAHQLSRHRVRRIDVHGACAALVDAEPA